MTPPATAEVPATTADATADAAADAGVSTTAVQLPTFFRDAPAAWFATISSVFIIKRIMDPITHYHHSVARLDSATAASIQEVLRSPVTNESFDRLKRRLCFMYDCTPKQKLDKAFGLTSIADKNPFVFAKELDRLFEGRTIDDVKSRILVCCLPRSVAQSITGSSLTYENLVHWAFRSWSNLKESDRLASVAAVNAPDVAAVQA